MKNFEKNLIINPKTWEPLISILPRMKDAIYVPEQDARPRTPWQFKNSIFAKYR